MDEFFEELRPGCFIMTHEDHYTVIYPTVNYGTNFIFPQLWALAPYVHGILKTSVDQTLFKAFDFHMKAASNYANNMEQIAFKRKETELIQQLKYFRENFK